MKFAAQPTLSLAFAFAAALAQTSLSRAEANPPLPPASSVFKAPHLAELAEAACEGDAAGVRRAIKAGANPNGLSSDGGPPLLWAVQCNNAIGVKALLDAGAEPNCKALGTDSPTLVASLQKDPSILRELLAQGGDPNIDDGHCWTALRYAMLLGTEQDRWDN